MVQLLCNNKTFIIMIQVSTIHFSEVNKFDDNNAIVITGITVDGVESIDEIDSFFHETGLFSDDKHVTGVSRILDNVLGDEGRTDLLFHLTEVGSINPMVRLQMRMRGMGVMWTNDFIDNYSKDYNYV